MPADYVYGIKITDDLTSQFEYSPPFRLSIPDSTFGKASTSNTNSTPTPTSAETTPSTTMVNTTPSTPPETSSEPFVFDSSAATDAGSMKIETIFGAFGAGVAVIALFIVVFAVWRRIQSDKKKMAEMPRSFRDRQRRSLEEEYSPIAEREPVHRRIPSTSSFGDGARASDLFERNNLEPSPKPLSPIADESPPPTPFAAPTLSFPAVAQLRPERRSSRGFTISPHFRSGPSPDRPVCLGRPLSDPNVQSTNNGLSEDSPPVGTNTYKAFSPTEASTGFTLGAAPGRHNFSRPVRQYTACNPSMPPTRPASATTGTDTTFDYLPP
jgi:hypothetical protein